MPTTTELLRERAQPWAEPINSDAPAGVSATMDPRHEFVRNEVARLDSPTGGTPRWTDVVERGGELLREQSKDLLVASYVAYALFVTRGIDGLATGLALLSALMEAYWPAMFPELKRLRGRVSALTWFIEKVAITLPRSKVGPADRAALDAVRLAAGQFAQITRARFESNAPALAPLLDGVERLMLDLPPEASAVVAPQPTAAAPPAASVVEPAPAPTATPPRPPPAPPAPAPMPTPPVATSLADGAEVAGFLRETGAALMRAAGVLRRTDATDPTSYRIMRSGAWIALAAPPPAGPGGKLAVPAPPANLRSQLERMAANQKWPELLEEAESAMTQHRLWLDLQRYSGQALGALGAAHVPARAALVAELGSFLGRMPGLAELAYGDGSPLADAATRSWLENEVLGAAGGSKGSEARPTADAAGPGGLSEAHAAAVAEARALALGGKPQEAVALLHQHATSAPAAARFRLRLAVARTCLDAGKPAVARAIFEGLERETVARGLEEWEPALTVEVLEGLVASIRATVRSGTPLPPDFATLYDRFCRLDPLAALRAGP